MLDFLARLFGREEPSGKQAKERLRLVLVHDRASISPHLLDMLRVDLIEVLSKYVEIDEDALEVNLEKDSDAMALVANIPIRGMKSSAATRTAN
ncbi:MAG: cell division topological specificity factor MinE [Limnochordia bacterium]|jgi:cell division topological specificity factor